MYVCVYICIYVSVCDCVCRYRYTDIKIYTCIAYVRTKTSTNKLHEYNPNRCLSGARWPLHRRECIACRGRARLGLAGVYCMSIFVSIHLCINIYVYV